MTAYGPPKEGSSDGPLALGSDSIEVHTEKSMRRALAVLPRDGEGD